MNNNDDTELIDMLKAGRHLRLDPAARARIRAALETHVAARPVMSEAAGMQAAGNRPMLSPYYPQRFSFSPAPIIAAGLIITISLGGSAAYAAEAALPGDLLYPIKVHVNETVREAIAVSAQEQAIVHAELSVRRLAEAEQLAASGALSTSTAAQLRAGFEKHAEKAHRASASVREHDPTLAAEIDSSLAARIAADADIVKSIIKADDEHGSLEGLAASLSAHLAASSSRATAAATSSAALSDARLAALARRAEGRLEDAAHKAREADARIGTTTQGTSVTRELAARFAAQATAAHRLAASRFDEGRRKAEAGDQAGAYEAFIASIDASMQAKAYAQAALRAARIGEGASRGRGGPRSDARGRGENDRGKERGGGDDVALGGNRETDERGDTTAVQEQATTSAGKAERRH